MVTCNTCDNWISATAECAVQLKAIANGWVIDATVENALDSDYKTENSCKEYR